MRAGFLDWGDFNDGIMMRRGILGRLWKRGQGPKPAAVFAGGEMVGLLRRYSEVLGKRREEVGFEGEDGQLLEAVRFLLVHYEEVCEGATDAVRASGLPQKFFYLEMGISRATFDRRMRRSDWTVRELGMLVEMFGR